MKETGITVIRKMEIFIKFYYPSGVRVCVRTNNTRMCRCLHSICYLVYVITFQFYKYRHTMAYTIQWTNIARLQATLILFYKYNMRVYIEIAYMHIFVHTYIHQYQLFYK